MVSEAAAAVGAAEPVGFDQSAPSSQEQPWTTVSDYERMRREKMKANQQHLDLLGLAGGIIQAAADRPSTTMCVDYRRAQLLKKLVNKLKQEQQVAAEIQKQLDTRACEVRKRVGEKVPEECRISCSPAPELAWKQEYDGAIPPGFDSRMLAGALIQR